METCNMVAMEASGYDGAVCSPALLNYGRLLRFGTHAA